MIRVTRVLLENLVSGGNIISFRGAVFAKLAYLPFIRFIRVY